MPRNIRSTSIEIDEKLGIVQVMLEAKLTNPYNEKDKRVCTHSVLDLFYATDERETADGWTKEDTIQLGRDIAATIDRCISIDRQGY